MQEDGGKIIPPVGFLCRARLVLAQLVLLLGQADPRKHNETLNFIRQINNAAYLR